MERDEQTKGMQKHTYCWMGITVALSENLVLHARGKRNHTFLFGILSKKGKALLVGASGRQANHGGSAMREGRSSLVKRDGGIRRLQGSKQTCVLRGVYEIRVTLRVTLTWMGVVVHTVCCAAILISCCQSPHVFGALHARNWHRRYALAS